ncbi:MAG: DUF4129 domain-containing protein [Propioniciclava sp.]
MIPLEVPIEVGRDQAREWAETELSDAAYRVTEPTWFDRAARAVVDYLIELLQGRPAPGIEISSTGLVLGILFGVLIAVAVMWGRPRRRARASTTSALFGDQESRSASELRQEASDAAARADWQTAIVLRMRALARGLAERTIVEPLPGATVHQFCREATAAFPDLAAELDHGAALFDEVRYLRRPGTEDSYRRLSALDERLMVSTPATFTPAAT